MLAERALQREDADRARYQPRSCMRSRLGDVRDVDADHRLAQVARHARDDVGVLEVRGRLDDRLRALRRVAALEDAGADEHAVAAELHHERRVGRGRDAARREVHDRQLAVLGDPLHELVRRLQLLGRVEELLVAQARRASAISSVTARMWRTASTTLPVPGSPLVRTIAAPSAMRRSASPRLRQPHTNGTVKSHLLTWYSSSAGREHLGLVDVVDAERLQHLRLDEVADAALRHDRDA